MKTFYKFAPNLFRGNKFRIPIKRDEISRKKYYERSCADGLIILEYKICSRPCENHMSEENKKTNAAPSSPTQSAALTKEDILRIAALPVKKMRVGNIVQDVICDEVTGYIYYPKLNPEGPYDVLDKKRTRYNPAKARELILEQEKADQENRKREEEELQKNVKPPELPNLFKKKAQTAETEGENNSGTETDTEESDSGKKEKQGSSKVPQVANHSLTSKKKKEKKSSQSLKKRLSVLGCAAAIAALGFCTYPVVKEAIQQRNPPEPDPPTVTESPKENSASIVQVVNDLIPGDSITADDLREATVSEETYSQITLQGINLYQWSRADALVGMYAQTYLPAGQYVSFSSIGASYEPPQSLWDSDSCIDIPLTAEQQAAADFLPGQKINVIFRRQVTQESPVTQEQDEVGKGGTATTIVQTTTIEEISLPDTTICDVFTGKNGEQSLYQALYALSTVPAGEQWNYISRAMQEEEFADQFHEKVLRIAVSQDDINKIGKLDFNKTQVSISSTNTFDKGDNERASFAAAEQTTMKNIRNAWSALQTQEETE